MNLAENTRIRKGTKSRTERGRIGCLNIADFQEDNRLSLPRDWFTAFINLRSVVNCGEIRWSFVILLGIVKPIGASAARK